MTLKRAYHWHETDRAWLGPDHGITLVPPSPEEMPSDEGGQYVYYPPGNATFDAVPESIPEGFWPRRADDNSAWDLCIDKRGTTYWLTDRTKHVIDELGVEPPADALFEDPGPTPQAQAETRKQEARLALAASDVTVLRCFEAGVPVPEAWRTYRSDLRAVIADGGPLPTKPEYPVGA